VSGHSKWATIRRKKGAVDAKRGKIFTKLIREIATAARLSGGDPDANPRLRLAVDRARLSNMPKDTIERAIKRGTGETEGAQFEEALYEGFGPGGAAVLVETLTDNRNRTVGEVRHVFSRWGGNLGANGCAAHVFRKRGLIQFDREGLDVDALLEAALDAGADDVQEGGDSVDVVTEPASFDAVRRALEVAGFRSTHAVLGREPTSTVKLEGKDAENMLALADALEDLDDVQSVSANFDISEAEMARLAG
jgi:YebC/PmpR family DNA-binding regulatory protein